MFIYTIIVYMIYYIGLLTQLRPLLCGAGGGEGHGDVRDGADRKGRRNHTDVRGVKSLI